jgi:hypothetical protein
MGVFGFGIISYHFTKPLQKLENINKQRFNYADLLDLFDL